MSKRSIAQSLQDILDAIGAVDVTSTNNKVETMTQATSFNQVLESIESLSIEDQEALVDLVKRRLIERKRATIAENIAEAKEAYRAGQVFRGTVDDVIAELND